MYYRILSGMKGPNIESEEQDSVRETDICKDSTFIRSFVCSLINPFISISKLPLPRTGH